MVINARPQAGRVARTVRLRTRRTVASARNRQPKATRAIAASRPSVFVLSSSEGLRVAQTVQVLLDQRCEVEVWNQGSFELSDGALDALLSALNRFDFAVLVLTADDKTVSRGVERPVARDNIVFELGLFVAGLGRYRTFMLYDRTQAPAIPSDLAGVVAATYEPHASGNLQAALGAACTRVLMAIEERGVRESENAPGATVPWTRRCRRGPGPCKT